MSIQLRNNVWIVAALLSIEGVLCSLE